MEQEDDLDQFTKDLIRVVEEDLNEEEIEKLLESHRPKSILSNDNKEPSLLQDKPEE